MVNHDKLIHPIGLTQKESQHLRRDKEIKEQAKESKKTLVVRQATPEERKRFGIK